MRSRRVTASAVLLLAASMTNIVSAANWTQYGFLGSHQSFNNAEKTLTRANVTRLAPLWSVGLGAALPVAPIVANGVAFVASGGTIRALDVRTGAQIWSGSSCTGSDAAQLAYSNNRLFVGDNEGDLAAYNAGTGALLWCRDEGGSIVSALAVDGDIVFASNDGAVFAVNAATGSGRWRYEAVGIPGPSSAPAIGGNTVFVTGPGMVYALKKDDGKVLWTRALGAPYALSSPSVSGDTVYVGADVLYALAVSDGKTRWTSGSRAGVNVSMPAISGNVVYVNAQDPAFGLFALNAKSGALIWRTTVAGESQATATVANGLIYDVGDRGQLIILDAATGGALVSLDDRDGHPFSDAPGAQVAVVNGAVYAVTRDTGATNKIDVFVLPH